MPLPLFFTSVDWQGIDGEVRRSRGFRKDNEDGEESGGGREKDMGRGGRLLPLY